MKVIARDFLTGTPYEYLIEEGLFRAIRPADSSHPEKLPWIAPGLYDVQVNGFGGVDFNNPISKDDWLKACSALATHGCTHFLATLITNNQENYRSLLTGIEKLRDEEDGCRGYHMEGPFLNPDPGTHGAHNTSWMCAANLTWLKEWQSISKNNIRLVTIAPEIAPEKSLEFIRQAVAQEIRISLGHSVATGEILKQAVDAGATCWTHLGNAIGRSTDKFDNVLFHVLAEKRLHASLIPDGIHIPDYAFPTLSGTLGNRLLITTDAMSGAGAPVGKYRLCQHEITMGEDRIARTPEGRLAGSTLTPFDAVFNAAAMSGQHWQIFWDALSTRPAKWLGVDHRLEAGLEASFCIIETTPKPTLRETYLKGRRVYSDA